MLHYSPEMSLGIILTFASVLNFFALFLENNFDSYISFYAFVIFSISYYFVFYLFIRDKDHEVKNV